MPKKATAEDAQLILKLYELRREPEMRKARNWWMTEFWPSNSDDFLKIAMNLGSQENNWLRQAAGYWGLAASLVLQGTLNADLFLRPSCSGEMFFMFGKVQPFVKEVREKLGDPEVFRDVEKVIASTKWGQDRLKFVVKRIETFRANKAQKA